MSRDCESRSTAERVDNQDRAEAHQCASTALFMDAMSSQLPTVTRASLEIPALSGGMFDPPPALNDKPKWQSPNPPALNDVPAWQNSQQPALDDRPNWQKHTSDPGGAPWQQNPAPWQNPNSPATDSQPSWQQQPSWSNPTPPILGGGSTNPGIPMDGPGNGVPWKSSWGDVAPGGPFNPAPPPVDSGKPWRAGWGDVAPGFPSTPPAIPPDSGKPWRAGWGDVAPGFPSTPPAIPPDSGKPWRAGWGDVASGFPTNPAQPQPDTGNGRSPWGVPTGFQVPSSPAPEIDRTSFDTTNGGIFSSQRHQSPWGGTADVPTPAPSFPAPTQSFPGGGIDSPSVPAPTRTTDTVPSFPSFPSFPAGGDRSPSFPPPSSDRGPAFPPPSSDRGPAFPTTDGGKNPGDFFPNFPGDNGGQRPSDNGNGRSTNPGDTRNDAVNAFNQDMANRTEFSFQSAVNKFKNLGKENEVALETQLRDWLNQKNSKNPITFMRGTALLADALGQFRLEAGSRIDQTSHQDTKPRILQGAGFDFGGEAATFLRMSAGSLVEAQTYARGHMGQVVDGQVMDNNYIQQLRNLQTSVESQLNVIYGGHDLNNVFNTLRSEVRVHSGDWQQGLVRLQRQLDGLRSTDNRFIAKSARDVALGYLAEADYKIAMNNGEDALIMYQSVNKYLALSMQRDPNAPDNAAIKQIADAIAPGIEKARDNQWNDPFNNPFQIPKPPAAIA